MSLNKDIFAGETQLYEALNPFACIKYAYDGENNVEFIGKFRSLINPSDDNPGWILTKLTWSGGYVTMVQNRIGTWTGRVTGWT